MMIDNNPDIRFLISKKMLPPFLGKYRTLSRVKEFIKNNMLFFSSYKDFNDPFEGDYNVNESSLITRQLVEEKLSNTTVFCLTYKFEDTLMWSHYADKMKGALLIFEVLEDENFFTNISNVVYQEDKLVLSENNLYYPLSFKFKDWKHEGEFRIFRSNSQNNLIEIKPSSLREICFGINTTEEERKEIITQTLERHVFTNVEFSLLTKHKQYFKYKRFKIDNNGILMSPLQPSAIPSFKCYEHKTKTQ